MTVLMLLALACNPTEPDTGVEDTTAFIPVMEAALDEQLGLGATGMAIAIFDRDGVVWTHGVGSRRVNAQEPVDGDTRFRFGSVLKMMTATALLQQQEAGALDLEDPLSKLMPDFSVKATPEWSSELHLADLISHRGGLYDHVELSAGPDDDALADGIAWFEDNAFLMSRPDAFYNYSNPNFSLAGRVIELADGHPYREVMVDDVFAPLGMERALFLGDTVMAQDDNWAEAMGRDWKGLSSTPVVIRPNSYDSGFSRPAGLGFASVNDLAAFGMFLMNGNTDVLSSAGHQTLISPISSLGANPTTHYANGIFVLDEITLGGTTYATTVLSHGGDINGYAADLYVMPEVGWGVAILASADAAHANETVSAALALAPNLPAPSPRTPLAAFDPATLDEIVGSWNDANNVGPMTLTVTEGTLHAELPLLDEYEIPYSDTLEPVAADTFRWEVQGYPFLLQVQRDADGQPEWLSTRSFVLQRAELRSQEPMPAQRPRVAPTGLVLSEPLPGLGR